MLHLPISFSQPPPLRSAATVVAAACLVVGFAGLHSLKNINAN